MPQRIKRYPTIDNSHPESGLGILNSPKGRLPLTNLDVKAQIHGLGAKTVVRQTFFNGFNKAIEATYIFPMPGRDAVTRFSMKVDGRHVEGELQERGQARQNYDEAISSGKVAAIAEEERSETFSMRVGNIPPGESVSIELTLVGQLSLDGEEAMYRFPLVVAPRYVSGDVLDGPPVGKGVKSDTDRVPDASRVSPPVLLPGYPNPVQLSIELDLWMPDGVDMASLSKQLRSSLHTILVNDTGLSDGMPLKIRIQPNERLDRDFVLRFPYLTHHDSVSLLAAPTPEGTSVFRLISCLHLPSLRQGLGMWCSSSIEAEAWEDGRWHPHDVRFQT